MINIKKALKERPLDNLLNNLQTLIWNNYNLPIFYHLKSLFLIKKSAKNIY